MYVFRQTNCTLLATHLLATHISNWVCMNESLENTTTTTTPNSFVSLQATRSFGLLSACVQPFFTDSLFFRTVNEKKNPIDREGEREIWEMSDKKYPEPSRSQRKTSIQSNLRVSYPTKISNPSNRRANLHLPPPLPEEVKLALSLQQNTTHTNNNTHSHT